LELASTALLILGKGIITMLGKKTVELGVGMHAVILARGRMRQKDHEFEPSLRYIMNSRPLCASSQSPDSKQTNTFEFKYWLRTALRTVRGLV
jgi:hypothetical protein